MLCSQQPISLMEFRTNNTLWNIAMTLGLLAMLATAIVVIVKNSNTTTIVSDTGCCSIEIDHITDYQYVVTWTDNTVDNVEWIELVEIEYPDSDMTPEQQIQHELEWTVNEMKDLCFTHHKH